MLTLHTKLIVNKQVMQETKTITQYRLQLRRRIIDTAMHEFTVNGIRAVKMDDIAHKLGISKRTLYELYENKEQLLYEGVKSYHDKKQQLMQAFEGEGHNVMEVIIHLYRFHAEEFRQTHPLFYEDVVRYTSVLDYIKARQRQTQGKFLVFMKRGVSEGFFRADINYVLVGQMFEAFTAHMHTQQLYQQYDFDELFFNTLFVMLRGFCTDKGIKFLDNFINENRQ